MARITLLASSVVSCLVSVAVAQIPAYTLVGQYQLPDGAAAWDVSADGHIVSMVGNTIMRQSSLNGSSHTLFGGLPNGTIPSWGASFIRSGPGGILAIGDNNFGSSARVYFYNPILATPTPFASIPIGNFDATWHDNSLYVTGADENFNTFVSRISLVGIGGQPSVQTLITNTGGGSAGVAIRNGRLYTGAGYQTVQIPTGQIRSFDLDTLNGSTTPVFFSTGTNIVTSLSASPLAFDPFGNLLVGGGDIFGGTSDFGYAAVINPLNTAEQLHLSPAGAGVIYAVNFNSVTNELLLSTNGTIYRYAVPAPGAAVLLPLSLFASRRRRV